MKVCHIHIEQMHIFLYICHMCGKISESLRLLTATANKVIFLLFCSQGYCNFHTEQGFSFMGIKTIKVVLVFLERQFFKVHPILLFLMVKREI